MSRLSVISAPTCSGDDRDRELSHQTHDQHPVSTPLLHNGAWIAEPPARCRAIWLAAATCAPLTRNRQGHQLNPALSIPPLASSHGPQ